MDTQTEINSSVKLRLITLTRKIVILSLVGLGSLIISLLMLDIELLKILVWIVYTSIAFLWFVVPSLEIYTVLIIFKKWDALRIINDKEDEKHISRIAGYLLAAAYISALIYISPSLLTGNFESGSTIRHIWSLIIASTCILMAFKSFMLCRIIHGQLLKSIASLFCIVAWLIVIIFTIYIYAYHV